MRKKHPNNYKDLVKTVIKFLSNVPYEEYEMRPDSSRIHQIDDGDYQGTLLFVIASSNYQPDTYWYVKVYYGSCSGCDTLQRIREDYRSDQDLKIPNDQQIDDYMTLALHIVQKLKKLD